MPAPVAPAPHRRGSRGRRRGALVAAAVLAGCGARPLLYRAPPAAGDERVALGLVHVGVSAAMRELYLERPVRPLVTIEGSAGAAPESVLVLVDTSASQALWMERQAEVVRSLVGALPPETAVAIAAFDHGVTEVFRGQAAGAGAGEVARALYDHGALGASDLGAALAYAAASGMARVVIVGEAQPTLGARDPAALAALVRGSPIARLDAVPVGPRFDRSSPTVVMTAWSPEEPVRLEPAGPGAPAAEPPPLGSFAMGLQSRQSALLWLTSDHSTSAYFEPRIPTWQEWRREDARRRRVPLVLAEPQQTRLALATAVDRMRSTAAPLGWPPPGWGHVPDRKPRWRTPYTGKLLAVMEALARGDRDGALLRAVRWQLVQPGDVAAVLALGESLEARGAGALAARAYASLADLYPHRADLLCAVGQRLDRVAASAPAARALAIDLYQRAVRADPTREMAHHLLAISLLRAGRAEEALAALDRGIRYTQDSLLAQILVEDVRLVAAHLLARRSYQALPLLAQLKVGAAARPSLRVVMGAESRGARVNLFVYDRAGDHASHRWRALSSGGELLAGHDSERASGGTEELLVEVPAAFPYRIGVRASGSASAEAGPALGTVQVIHHDGKGGFSVEDRPFVLQRVDAMAEVGRVAGPASR